MRISGITYVPRKSHKVRKVISILLAIILVVVISLALISAYVGWKLTHPKKVDIPAFESNIMPEYKDITFNDIKKDVKLKGWFLEANGSNKTVIFAHSHGSNRLQFGKGTLNLVKSLINAGYNVLMFDFRHSGKSGGSASTLGYYEKNDLLGAINYAKLSGAKQIVLLGFSSGASASITAAADSQDVDALIVDSPFADLNKYLDQMLPSVSKLPRFPFNTTIKFSLKLLEGLDISEVSPTNVITGIVPRPILFIHSKDDKDVPVADSRELYDLYIKAAPGKAEFWETSGAGHLGSYEKYSNEYIDRILSFLDNNISKKK